MKISLIFLALIVLVSGCTSFSDGIEVSNNNFTLPTIVPPTTEALSGGAGGIEPAQATTTTSQATSNSCPVPHGAGNYAGGLCAVVSCDSGYYNCDGNNANGCEATAQCATTTTSPAGANTTTTTSANATTTSLVTTTTSSGATTTAAATTTSGATTTTAAATTTTAAATTTTTPPTTTTAPKPDMTSTYTSEAHSGPAPTYTVIVFKINNIGTASSGGNSWARVEARKSGQTTQTCDYAMSDIAAGSSYSGASCGFTLSAGYWLITIYSDYTSLIDESNEVNNNDAMIINLS